MTAVTAASVLLERVRSSLAAEAGPPTPARLAAALRSEGAVLGDAAVLEVSKQLRSEISGAGPLEALLREPGVTDVLVNCPGEVWVDRGAGLERSPFRLRDGAAVRGLAQRLAAAAGRRLDGAAPFVDVRLPGGTRLHAVLPPVSPAGTETSPGCGAWCASVPSSWTSCTRSSPRMNSWSIGSVFSITKRTVSPGSTASSAGSNFE